MSTFESNKDLVEAIFNQFDEIDLCGYISGKKNDFEEILTRKEVFDRGQMIQMVKEVAPVKGQFGNDFNYVLEWRSGKFVLIRQVNGVDFLVIASKAKIFPLVNLYLRGISISQVAKEGESDSSGTSAEQEALSMEELMENIEAAKQLKSKILSKPEILGNYFTNHSLFYRSMDGVGGDFYMLLDFTEALYVVVCDCTGDGIDGAIGTIKISSMVNQYIKSTRAKPQNVVTKILHGLQKFNAKEGEEQGQSLSAELVIGKFEKGTKTFEFSTSGVPIARVSGGTVDMQRVKKKLGLSHIMRANTLINETWELKSGDKIFIYTDGISNQVSADGSKRLTHKGVIEMAETEKSDKEFQGNWDKWKGKAEQVDDAVYISMTV